MTAAPRLTAEAFAEGREGVRRVGEGRWMAKCPAHGDKGPSLSIRRADDGRVLLHCFSGCSFQEIVVAAGVRPQQLFPESDRPWRPTGPRPDPQREALTGLVRLRAMLEPPEPHRIKKELIFVGRLILGGTEEMRDVPQSFSGEALKFFPARLLFEAAQAVAAQGTPRRRFSSVALAREFDRVGGPGSGKRHQVGFWARVAVGMAGRTGNADAACNG